MPKFDPYKLVRSSEAMAIRNPDRRTDHEIEFAVVIGKKLTA